MRVSGRMCVNPEKIVMRGTKAAQGMYRRDVQIVGAIACVPWKGRKVSRLRFALQTPIPSAESSSTAPMTLIWVHKHSQVYALLDGFVKDLRSRTGRCMPRSRAVFKFSMENADMNTAPSRYRMHKDVSHTGSLRARQSAHQFGTAFRRPWDVRS